MQFMVLGTTAFTIAGGCYKVGYHIWVMTVTDIVMINRVSRSQGYEQFSISLGAEGNPFPALVY